MADDRDDDAGEKVRKAMAGKKAPPKLSVVEGGKADKPKRRGKAKAEAPERDPLAEGEKEPAAPTDAEVADGGDEDAGVVEFEAPIGTSPEDRERAMGCVHLDQNDLGNAHRFLKHFGSHVLFVQGMEWLTFRGTHWERDQGNLGARKLAQAVVDMIKLESLLMEASPAQARLLEAAGKAGRKAPDKRTERDKQLMADAAEIQKKLTSRRESRWKFAVSTGNLTKTKSMLEQAAPHRAAVARDLDTDHMQFNVKNGTLRFVRVENEESDPDSPTFHWQVRLEPHERADLITKLADVEYDPDAACPKWEAFLGWAQPEADMQMFLKVFHGYAILMGGNGEQLLVFHFGEGANGKSAFLEALGQMAGTYRTVVSPDSMVGDNQRDGSKASGDIARLHSARFVTVEELPRGTPLRENLIKALTGGTKQVARFNFKDEFEFDPIFTAAMTGNDMPEVSGTDHGIWRRLLITPWMGRLPEAERRNFADVMADFAAERSGILNWLIAGALAYLNDGMAAHIPEKVRAFTRDYQEERDHVATFLNACVIKEPGARTTAEDMYQGYMRWCEANAQKPWTQTAFGRYLNTRGYKKARSARTEYLDVRLGDIPTKSVKWGEAR